MGGELTRLISAWAFSQTLNQHRVCALCISSSFVVAYADLLVPNGARMTTETVGCRNVLLALLTVAVRLSVASHFRGITMNFIPQDATGKVLS